MCGACGIHHLAEGAVFIVLPAGLDDKVGEAPVRDGIAGVDISLVITFWRHPAGPVKSVRVIWVAENIQRRAVTGNEPVFSIKKVIFQLPVKSYEQEAELYFKLDQSKGRLRLSHATKALLESGTDAEVLEIKRRVEAAGFVWVLDKKSGDAYEILSTRAIINAYRLLGGAAFSRLLVLLDSTWHGASISLRASMLSGMALFLKTYETELDDRSFIKRLSAVDPEEIIRRGKMDFSTNKAALRFARVILEKYNTQQRGGRKLPYRFKG